MYKNSIEALKTRAPELISGSKAEPFVALRGYAPAETVASLIYAFDQDLTIEQWTLRVEALWLAFPEEDV